jgi:hypothetical protein
LAGVVENHVVRQITYSYDAFVPIQVEARCVACFNVCAEAEKELCARVLRIPKAGASANHSADSARVPAVKSTDNHAAGPC